MENKNESPHGFVYAKSLGFFMVMFLAVKLLIAALQPVPSVQSSDLTPGNIIAAINKERADRNLVTLNENSMLTLAAQDKAQDMTVRKYFSHTNPEGNYIWPDIVAAGYTPYLQLGENLAIEFYNTETLVAAWMNSPTHRANVLNEGFKDQGMGLSFGSVQNGEYHSAIVNTFGALVRYQTPPAPAPTPTPNPQPAPQPTPQPKPEPKPTPTPPPDSAPATSSPPITVIVPTSSRPSVLTPVHIETATLAITGTIEGKQLVLSVAVQVSGPAQHVNIQLADYTALLNKISPGNFAGSLRIPYAAALESMNILILAQSTAGVTDTASLPLNAVEISGQETPAGSVAPNTPPTPVSVLSAKGFNSFITLTFAGILLLLLLLDTLAVLQKKLDLFDKKLNNLVVLIISLVLVALAYFLK